MGGRDGAGLFEGDQGLTRKTAMHIAYAIHAHRVWRQERSGFGVNLTGVPQGNGDVAPLRPESSRRRRASACRLRRAGALGTLVRRLGRGVRGGIERAAGAVKRQPTGRRSPGFHCDCGGVGGRCCRLATRRPLSRRSGRSPSKTFSPSAAFGTVGVSRPSAAVATASEAHGTSGHTAVVNSATNLELHLISHRGLQTCRGEALAGLREIVGARVCPTCLTARASRRAKRYATSDAWVRLLSSRARAAPTRS